MALQLGVVARQLERAQQQLGEIDDTLTIALQLIRGVDAHELALRVITLILHMLRTARFFLLRVDPAGDGLRSEEHTSELQSLMRISYAVFCLKKKKNNKKIQRNVYATNAQIM